MDSLQDINFAQHMYTKISDINFNSNENPNLDFINYDSDEKKIQKPKIKKNLKNKIKKAKESVIRKYILMFLLSYILNSYYFINLINKNKLNYTYSLILRGFLFIILYHFLKSFC